MTAIEGCSFKNTASRIVARCNNSEVLKLIKSKWVKFRYLHILGDFPEEKLDCYYQMHENIDDKRFERGDLVLINKNENHLNLFRFANKLGITVIIMANRIQNINQYLETTDIYLCNTVSNSDVSLFGLKRVINNINIPDIFMIYRMHSNLLITTPFVEYNLFIDSNFQKGILVSSRLLQKYYSVITSPCKIICFDKIFKTKKTISKLYMFAGMNCINLMNKLDIQHNDYIEKSRPLCLHLHNYNYLRAYKFCDHCKLPSCHQLLYSICSNCLQTDYNP